MDEAPRSRPALLDPVSKREIQGIARRWQTYVGRVVYVGLIGYVVYQFWSNEISSHAGIFTASDYAELGRKLFHGFAIVQLVFVTVAALAAAADSVTREVRSGTLGLLLLTPLTPARIALGKWMGAMTQAIGVILCGLPVLAICVYLGGVGLWELGWSTGLTLAAAALSAALALRYSAVAATPTRAILMTVSAHVGLALAPLLLFFALGPLAKPVITCVHPGYAAWGAIYGGLGEFETFGWILATPLTLFFSWLIVVRSAGPRLEKRATSPPSNSTLRGDFSSLDAWYSRLPGVRRSRKAATRFRGDVWEHNPLLWKELATRAAGHVNRDVKQVFLIYFSVFILACWIVTTGDSFGTFVFLGALFLLMAITNGASLFSTDKEGRKMEMLLSTPVTAGQIVNAKLLSGVVSPEALSVLSLWLLTVVGWSWRGGPVGILATALASSLFLAFAYVMAAVTSLRAPTLRGAFTASLVVMVCLLVVLPSIATVLDTRSNWAALLSQVLHPLWILGHAENQGPSYVCLPVYLLIYVTLTTGLLLALPPLFRRTMGRL